MGLTKQELAEKAGYCLSSIYNKAEALKSFELPGGIYQSEAVDFLKRKTKGSYRKKRAKKIWMGHRWPENDLEKIQRACKKAGLSGTEIIRRGALETAKKILGES